MSFSYLSEYLLLLHYCFLHYLLLVQAKQRMQGQIYPQFCFALFNFTLINCNELCLKFAIYIDFAIYITN